MAGRGAWFRRCICRGPGTPISSARRSTTSPTCATSSSARARARRRPASPAAPLARLFLRALGVEVRSHVVQIGSVLAAGSAIAPLTVADFDAVDDDPVRCLDPEASRAMVQHINVQRKANESLGGVFEVIAFGLVPGLGSHVSWEERLDGRLAGALCSIQAIKGVGLGEGFDLAGKPGSQRARRDLLRRRSAATTARRTMPAASRAA